MMLVLKKSLRPPVSASLSRPSASRFPVFPSMFRVALALEVIVGLSLMSPAHEVLSACEPAMLAIAMSLIPMTRMIQTSAAAMAWS